MSARDSSALAYVSSLRHGRKPIHRCKCERCVELCHVLKLATDFCSLKRVAQYKQHATKARQAASRNCSVRHD